MDRETLTALVAAILVSAGHEVPDDLRINRAIESATNLLNKIRTR